MSFWTGVQLLVALVQIQITRQLCSRSKICRIGSKIPADFAIVQSIKTHRTSAQIGITEFDYEYPRDALRVPVFL